MKPNEYAQAQAWNSLVRFAAMGFLFLSAFMALCSAIVISVLDTSENANILRAALLTFAALALAVAMGFRKAEFLTWKHWLVICVLAAPAAAYTFFH